MSSKTPPSPSSITGRFFDSAYYDKVIAEHGYAGVNFSTVDFPLRGYDAESMKRRFLCTSGGEEFAQAVRNGEKCIVTTGFGMSGIPHLGTLSQIIKIVELNRHGMTT